MLRTRGWQYRGWKIDIQRTCLRCLVGTCCSLSSFFRSGAGSIPCAPTASQRSAQPAKPRCQFLPPCRHQRRSRGKGCRARFARGGGARLHNQPLWGQEGRGFARRPGLGKPSTRRETVDASVAEGHQPRCPAARRLHRLTEVGIVEQIGGGHVAEKLGGDGTRRQAIQSGHPAAASGAEVAGHGARGPIERTQRLAARAARECVPAGGEARGCTWRGAGIGCGGGG